MNCEKVASLWADKNVTLNTESSFNGIIKIYTKIILTSHEGTNEDSLTDLLFEWKWMKNVQKTLWKSIHLY